MSTSPDEMEMKRAKEQLTKKLPMVIWNATTLNLSSEKLKDPDVLVLATISTLTALDLQDNEIQNAGALAHHPKLETLSLRKNRITKEGVKDFRTNRTLRVLNIAWNQIGDEGAEDLASSAIEVLDVSHNEIYGKCAKAFMRNTSLVKLTISWNFLWFSDAVDLAANTNIVELDISYNRNAGSEDVVLKKNPRFQDLDTVSRVLGTDDPVKNALMEPARQWLCSLESAPLEALAKNTRFRILACCGNQIGDAEFFRQNNTVTDLDLSYNRIRSLDAFEHNTALTALHCVRNEIDCEGLKLLQQSNTTLKSLNLNGNQIRDEGAETLALMSNLENLCLISNEIGNKGAKALAMHTGFECLLLINNPNTKSLKELYEEGLKEVAQKGNTSGKAITYAYHAQGSTPAVQTPPPLEIKLEIQENKKSKGSKKN
jgi:Leucine-rich repeat (LRR) protein